MPTPKHLERLLRQRRFEEARQCLATMPPDMADLPAVRRGRAVLAHGEGRLADATVLYQALLEESPEPGDAVALGSLWMQLGRHEQARDHYRRWLARWPDSAVMLRGLGEVQAALGDRREAVACLRRAVELDPCAGLAWYRLTVFGDYDWLGSRRQALLAPPDAARPPHDQYGLLFAAARLLEHEGRYDEAFERLQAANELRRRWGSINVEQHIRDGRVVMADWDAQDWAAAGPGHESHRPIFIIGMPRSGTSLLEQVLASHPEVQGLGERIWLREELGRAYREAGAAGTAGLDWAATAARYLRRVAEVAGGESRITEKPMLAHNMVGHIHRLFPNAAIIWCRRDPLDTCVACFRTSFSSLDLSWTLRELGRFHGYCDAMMEYWRAQCGESILEVCYEDLVTDPRTQVERLLAALGLPWSDRCLSFHESRRVVLTASMEQVRRPFYRSAIGRAEPYRKHLGPLRAGMEEARAQLARAVPG